MNEISVVQDDDLSEFEGWAREFNESDEDIIPIHVIATWTITHTNGHHSHVTEVGYPESNERTFFEHNEDNGDYPCESFDHALRCAFEYLGERGVE